MAITHHNQVFWTPENTDNLVPLQIFDTMPAGPGESAAAAPPMLLINGLGEGNKSAKRSLRYLHQKGFSNVACVVLPTDAPVFVPTADLPALYVDMAVHVPQIAARFLQASSGDPRPLQLLGHSGGTIAAVLAAHDSASSGEDLFGDMYLFSAVGLNVDALGDTNKARTDEVKRRMRATTSAQNMFDPLLLSSEVPRNIRTMAKRRILTPSYDVVANVDSSRAAVALADSRRLTFATHPNDMVATPAEQRAGIARYPGNRVQFVETPGGHHPVATMPGLPQLLHGAQVLRG